MLYICQEKGPMQTDCFQKLNKNPKKIVQERLRPMPRHKCMMVRGYYVLFIDKAKHIIKTMFLNGKRNSRDDIYWMIA